MRDIRHHIMERAYRNRAAYLCFLVCLLMAAMSLFTPVCLDDYLFRFYWTLKQGSIAGYIDTVRFEENGRFGNLAFPLFDNLGEWWIWKILFGITTGVLITAIGWMARGIAGGRAFNAVALSWILATILLPWRAGMFVADFHLNYIPGSLLGLAYIWILFHRSAGVGIAVAALLSFFTGLQHEGLSVTLGVGSMTVLLLQRGKMNKKQWVMAAALALGACVQMSSEGIWLKAGSWNAAQWSVKGFIKSCPALILLCLALPLMLSAKWRGLRRNGLFLTCLAMSLSGFLFILVLGTGNERTVWFQQVFAAVALTAVVLKGMSPRRHVGRVMTVLAVGIALFWGIVVWRQYAVFKDYNRIVSQFEKGALTVYSDCEGRRSKWTLWIPLEDIWNNPIQIMCLNSGGDSMRPKGVLPASLKHIGHKDIKRVDGSAKAFFCKGMLFMEDAELLFSDSHGNKVESMVGEIRLIITDSAGTKVVKSATAQRVLLPAVGTVLVLRGLDDTLPSIDRNWKNEGGTTLQIAR